MLFLADAVPQPPTRSSISDPFCLSLHPLCASGGAIRAWKENGGVGRPALACGRGHGGSRGSGQASFESFQAASGQAIPSGSVPQSRDLGVPPPGSERRGESLPPTPMDLGEGARHQKKRQGPVANKTIRKVVGTSKRTTLRRDLQRAAVQNLS